MGDMRARSSATGRLGGRCPEWERTAWRMWMVDAQKAVLRGM